MQFHNLTLVLGWQFCALKSRPNAKPGKVACIINLKVYDIIGKEIATLLNEQLKPGTYEFDFVGNNYSSGVYYYKLFATGIAGDFMETKKMVLVK